MQALAPSLVVAAPARWRHARAGNRRSIRRDRRRRHLARCSGSSSPFSPSCGSSTMVGASPGAAQATASGRGPARDGSGTRAAHDDHGRVAVGADRDHRARAHGPQLRGQKALFSPQGRRPSPSRSPATNGGGRSRYEDAQPNRVFTTANEIHIPVGEPVLIKLESSDVIHSLLGSEPHGQAGPHPRRENSSSSGRRAGHLSRPMRRVLRLQHAHMGMLVVAEPKEDFERWRDHQITAAEPPSDRRAAARAGDLPLEALRHVPLGPRHRRRRQGRARSHPCGQPPHIAAGTLPMTPRQSRGLDRRPAGHQAGRPHAADQARAGRGRCRS